MGHQYASVQDVANFLGVSVPTIWNWAGDGKYAIADFPKAKKLGPQVRRWDMAEIVSWAAAQSEGAA